ncbi:prephenate dehydrogenase [Hazenella coriacea]|uniref:Prephenate dehydrogenase n=1 Tax=Hazenella coriacea TaxID=1179467 RepID=A0A4R3L2G2_9BACL|nr:prephenate dehydrogenase [Hazenella coriacea]TCS93382.1 prephenate dehydrogenase [Hazenella coriacea]
MPERVAILGMGLIGGSIALGLKERTSVEVIGFDHADQNLQLAESLGAIDKGTTQLNQAVEGVDFIIIALPVTLIKHTILELSALSLSSNCIVTDVGSTKAEIVQTGKVLIEQGVTFIGGHPMAGSHQSGMQAAQSLLFENAYYVLTPEVETSMQAIQRLGGLLERATLAKLVLMEPSAHDRVVGAISHLPHVIAAGLVNQVGKYNEENEWFHLLAAGGFRDLTRIGASDPTMWRDILLTNHQALIPLLDDWIKQMVHFRTAIQEKNADQIEELFTRSRELRRQLPEKKRKGILAPFFECVVDICDQPGEIAYLTKLLGQQKINIKNICILENREYTPGVLRLSFQSQQDVIQAVTYLRHSGYTVYMDDE